MKDMGVRQHEKKHTRKLRILQNYLDNVFDKKKLPVVLEYPFNFMINNLKVGGRIDRVDLIEDNKSRLIDYKTGSNCS